MDALDGLMRLVDTIVQAYYEVRRYLREGRKK